MAAGVWEVSPRIWGYGRKGNRGRKAFAPPPRLPLRWARQNASLRENPQTAALTGAAARFCHCQSATHSAETAGSRHACLTKAPGFRQKAPKGRFAAALFLLDRARPVCLRLRAAASGGWLRHAPAGAVFLGAAKRKWGVHPLAAPLTIRPLSDIIPPVHSEEEEQYPPRCCKENPWLVKRGERTAANTPWSWHPNGLRPSRRAPGAPVTARPCVGTA